MNMKWIEKHDPVQERAAMHWEQGLTLGNGKIGAVVWGGGEHRPLTISVDQAEIWDMRTWLPDKDRTWTEYKKLLEQGRGAEVDGFAYGPEDIHTMRIPVGRLEMRADGRILKHHSRLRLYEARCEGTITTEKGKLPYAVWASACRQLMIVEYTKGALTPNWKFICRDGDYTADDIQDTTVYPYYKNKLTLTQICRKWGYPDMKHGKDGDVEWFSQEIPESGAFAVACGIYDGYMLASIQWNTVSAEDAVKAAVLAVRDGREAGLPLLREEHEKWWADYYRASAITIPDTRLEGYYYLETYTLACCTRPEGPHMTLCGPWSDDTGYGPICDNDYHWNNEQEMQVWPVYTGNRLDFAEPMYRMIEENLETLKDVCRLHFKCDGAFLTHSTDSRLRPTYASVDNYELNGLPWVCFHFWKHYRYTLDRDFLEKRAYPLMKLAVIPLLSELKEGSDGCLHYPWSSSPEYHGVNETYRWMRKEAPDWTHRFGPDATIDLALTKWLLKTLCEASALLDEDPDQREVWTDTLSKLAPYAKDQWGGYAVRRDVELVTSHRHMSLMVPIYPLCEINMENDPETIESCLDVIGMLGRGEWVGWTFPWASIMYTHAGRAAASRNILLDYIDRYATETGIHYQGPQGKCDVSLYGDGEGTFGQTIEAQLGVPEAVHEMLMRTENGAVRIFRDCPPAWAECAFTGLRCEGAFLLDAARDNYITTFVKVYAEKGGRIIIDTDFGTGELTGPAEYADGICILDMKPGETAIICRRDIKETAFAPLVGNCTEDHYFGVKRVRRF